MIKLFRLRDAVSCTEGLGGDERLGLIDEQTDRLQPATGPATGNTCQSTTISQRQIYRDTPGDALREVTITQMR